MDLVLVPGTLIPHLAVQLLPSFDFLFAVDKRKHCAGIDLDVGVSGQFKHAQRVSDLLVAPLVSAHDRDAQGLDLRRLQHHQHGLLVGGGGAAGILIENYLAPGLRLGESSSKKNDGHQTRNSLFHVSPPKAANLFFTTGSIK